MTKAAISQHHYHQTSPLAWDAAWGVFEAGYFSASRACWDALPSTGQAAAAYAYDVECSTQARHNCIDERLFRRQTYTRVLRIALLRRNRKSNLPMETKQLLLSQSCSSLYGLTEKHRQYVARTML